MNTENIDRTDGFSVLPLLGVGALLLALVGGLFSGCDLDVSLATKHIAPNEHTWTFEVWGTKANQNVNFTVSSNVDWMSVSPASGTSSGPSNKVLVTVTVGSGVAADSEGVISVSARAGKAKTIQVTTGANYFTAEYTNGIPLSDMSLLFSPTAQLSGYTEEVSSVIGYLTNPANGTVLNLTGQCVKVDLSDGKTFPFYGQTYSSVYVNEHGRISLNGCVDAVSTLEEHFATRGISALSTANAASGGEVSIKQTADRLAVTFENVPSAGATNANNFQMELFFNGTVRLTYLDLDAAGAIIGLSQGNGMPDDFVKSELAENYNTGSLKSE